MSSVQVQGTNDSSILSKQSMVKAGYFKDEYVSYFAQKDSRRSPLINMGYFVRATVVESTVALFLESMRGTPSQVLSLGAGFDTSAFRFHDSLTSVIYFEVDFAEVVKNKVKCILNSEPLLETLNDWREESNPYGLISSNYVILEQDMSNISQLEKNLIQVNFDFNKPTLLLSECSITYMEETDSTKLIEWAAKVFKNAVFVTYEQINPNDGFGIVMANHFINIQSPLKSLDAYKTKEDQVQRYLTCGWENCSSIGVFDAFENLLSDEKMRENYKLEPFDEWEEWHLKCCHYTLVIATNGTLHQIMSPYISRIFKTEENLTREYLSWALHKEITMERFGHVVLPFTNEISLILGGFGPVKNNYHSRIKSISVLNQRKHTLSEIEVTHLSDPAVFDAMHHRCCIVSKEKDEVIFGLYGGRTSPLNCVNCTPYLITVSKRFSTFKVNTERLVIEGTGPCGRWRHSFENVDNCLYVYGGRTSDLKVLGDFWTLDLNSTCKRWNEIELDYKMPCARFSHSSAVLEKQIIIAGGLNSDYRPLSDIWIYNIIQRSWYQAMIVGFLARYGHTAHIYGRRMFLIGGVNCNTVQQPGICIVCLDSLLCTEYRLPEVPELPIMLHNHSSILTDDGKIMVIGGGGNCFSFGTSFNKPLIEINILQPR